MKKSLLVIIAITAVGQAYSQQLLDAAPPEKGVITKTLKPVANANPKSIPAIWGVGAPVGAAEGEFQTPFINSTSGYPYSPTDWTAQTIFETDGSVTPGNAYWTITSTGMSQGAYATGIPPISSPTQSNGAAIFDSDFMDNAGITGNFGMGSSPTDHRGELISPRIDLTGYTDSVLSVRFFSKWRNFANYQYTSISTDDGATWIDIQTDQLLGAQFNSTVEGWVELVFFNATIGVSNLSQCRIRFVFEGDYYFQIIDDVSIQVAAKHDLHIALGDPNFNTVEDYYNQYQITNNKQYPISQLTEKNFVYGANVKNNGYQDLVPTDNATFQVQIERDISGTWTPVYSETLPIDTVAAGTSGTPMLDTLDDYSWAQVGDYRVIYKVFSPYDINHDNDSVFNYFSISANTYASKVMVDNAQLPIATAAVFPGGNFDKFEFGSVFSFPSAGTETLKIDSLTYQYFVPTGYTGNDQVYVRLNIYEWTDGQGNGTADGFVDDVTELALVATTIDTLTGLLGNLGNYGNSTRQIEDLNLLVPSYAMQDDKYYYASVAFENTLNGLSTLNNTNMIHLGVDGTFRYDMNMYQTNAADIVSSPSVIVVENFGSTDVYGIGFTTGEIPSIGVHLSGYCEEAIADFDTTTNYLAVSFTDASTSTSTGGAIIAWNWDFGDGTTSTLQNPTHIYADSGTYVVCLTITDDCGSLTTCDTISVDKNFADLSNNWMDLVQVYPIPTSDLITVDGLQFEGSYTVDIVDLSGKTIRSFTFNGETTVTLDLSNQASGSYLLRLSNGNSNISKSLLILK